MEMPVSEEVVHLSLFRHSVFDKPALYPVIREFGKGINGGKSHSYWLARFNRKKSFHFPRSLTSDRSVWHNGEHPGFL